MVKALKDVRNSFAKESYIDYAFFFSNECPKFPNFLEYFETIIIDQVKEKIVNAWV